MALLIYVDDGIFIGPKQADIDAAYELLVKEFVDNHGIRHRPFIMTNEGDLADYLGVRIDRLPNALINCHSPT